jgi:hypothetical protein
LTVTGIESVVTFNNTLIQAFSSLPDGCVNWTTLRENIRAQSL